MRKFKLIQKYPASPEVGYITQFNSNGEDWKTPAMLLINECTDYPEFWQEIIEKDYQILKLSLQRSVKPEVVDVSDSGEEYILSLLKCNGNSIHSVKRLSDGEVFTVGDKIDDKYLGTVSIRGFKIINNKMHIIYLDYDYPLEKTIKLKEVLFRTEDGVDIFEGDKYYSINANLKEKIQEIFTTKDTIKSCFYRYFSTKKAAEDYIIRNKLCLSIQDVDSISEWDGLIESLEELVKSRL